LPIGHLTGRKLEVVKRCVSKWWHSFSFQAFDETGCHLLVTQSCMDKLRMHVRLKFYSKVCYAITINLNSFKVSLVHYIISKYLNSKHVNNCLLFYKKRSNSADPTCSTKTVLFTSSIQRLFEDYLLILSFFDKDKDPFFHQNNLGTCRLCVIVAWVWMGFESHLKLQQKA